MDSDHPTNHPTNHPASRANATDRYLRTPSFYNLSTPDSYIPSTPLSLGTPISSSSTRGSDITPISSSSTRGSDITSIQQEYRQESQPYESTSKSTPFQRQAGRYQSPRVIINPLRNLVNYVPYLIQASLFYQEASAILSMSDHSLTGFAEYFRGLSREKYDQSNVLIDYLCSREYEFRYENMGIINVKVQQTTYDTLLSILESAVDIQKQLYTSLLVMSKTKDVSLTDMVVKWLHVLEDELHSIKGLLTKIRDTGPHSIHIMDQKMHSM